MAFPPLLRIVLSRLPFLLFCFNELWHAHNTCAHMGLTLAALHVVCGPSTKKQLSTSDMGVPLGPEAWETKWMVGMGTP
jgi:hypothetical protein